VARPSSTIKPSKWLTDEQNEQLAGRERAAAINRATARHMNATRVSAGNKKYSVPGENGGGGEDAGIGDKVWRSGRPVGVPGEPVPEKYRPAAANLRKLTFEFDLSSSPVSSDYVHDDADLCMIMGPYGSGKTSATVIKCALRAMRTPPDAWGVRRYRILVVRNTMPALRQNALKSILGWFPEIVVKNGNIEKMGWGYWRTNTSEYHVGLSAPERDGGIKLWKLDDGTYVVMEFVFVGLDQPQDVERVMGGDYTDIWLNEYELLPVELALTLLSRKGRFPSKGSVQGERLAGSVFGDTNPPDEGSEWWSLFEEPESPDVTAAREKFKGVSSREIAFHIHKQPSGLSPEAENLQNLEPAFYQTQYLALTQMGRVDDINKKIHGYYGKGGGGRGVYSGKYDATKHRSRTPIPFAPDRTLCLGFDFGRVHCAAIYFQMTKEGRYLVLGEIDRKMISTPMFLEAVAADLFQRFRVTPSQTVAIGEFASENVQSTSGKSDMQVAREKGFVNSRMSYKDPEPGWRAVDACLVQGRLLIDPTCTMLLRGFEGQYMFEKTREGGAKKVAVKNEYSEFHDALKTGLAYFEEEGRNYDWIGGGVTGRVRMQPFFGNVEWDYRA